MIAIAVLTTVSTIVVFGLSYMYGRSILFHKKEGQRQGVGQEVAVKISPEFKEEQQAEDRKPAVKPDFSQSIAETCAESEVKSESSDSAYYTEEKPSAALEKSSPDLELNPDNAADKRNVSSSQTIASPPLPFYRPPANTTSSVALGTNPEETPRFPVSDIQSVVPSGVVNPSGENQQAPEVHNYTGPLPPPGKKLKLLPKFPVIVNKTGPESVSLPEN